MPSTASTVMITSYSRTRSIMLSERQPKSNSSTLSGISYRVSSSSYTAGPTPSSSISLLPTQNTAMRRAAPTLRPHRRADDQVVVRRRRDHRDACDHARYRPDALALEVRLLVLTEARRAMRREGLAQDGEHHRAHRQREQYDQRDAYCQRRALGECRIERVVGEQPDGIEQDSGPHAVRGAPDRRQEQRADVEPGNTLEELLFASDLFVGQFSHNSLSLSCLRRLSAIIDEEVPHMRGL